jgi:hypothetical protein
MQDDPAATSVKHHGIPALVLFYWAFGRDLASFGFRADHDGHRCLIVQYHAARGSLSMRSGVFAHGGRGEADEDWESISTASGDLDLAALATDGCDGADVHAF